MQMLSLFEMDRSKIKSFNQEYFPVSSKEEEIERIQNKIDELKEEILKNMKAKHELESSDVIDIFTSDQLTKFFKKHPAMQLSYKNSILTLISSKQSISFHGESTDDFSHIVYQTLPLYSFDLDFLEDGGVAGKANDFSTKDFIKYANMEVADNNYGHPNATLVTGKNKLATICDGTNRFIGNYYDSCSNGKIKKATEIVRILSKAAIWLESANLSDMYGTNICPVVKHLNFVSDKDFIMGYLEAVQQDITYVENWVQNYDKGNGERSDLVQAVEFVSNFSNFGAGNEPTRTKHYLLFFFAWALYLATNQDLLTRCSIHKESLINAINMDIATLIGCYRLHKSGIFSPIGMTSQAELKRLLNIAVDCPKNLAHWMEYRKLTCDSNYQFIKNIKSIKEMYND